MNHAALQSRSREIVVDEIFPHSPETVWKALTDGELIRQWMPMQPVGFEPVQGNRFTLHTTPAGLWDGTIECEVTEATPNWRLAYSWKGGHEANVGYGSLLDTIVTFTLLRVPGGTRVRLVHSGFVLPTNETAFSRMSQGWPTVIENLGEAAGG